MSNNAAGGPEDQVAPPPADVEDLRLELSKWQARVPKLAAALRERAEQVAKLQAQVDALAKPDPGAQVRDELIAELEAKLGALNSKHQDTQGQLHSRDMEINALRQDAADWREKWQSVTRALDEQAVQAAGREAGLKSLEQELATVKDTLKARSEAYADQDHELELLRAEAESLAKRNAQLFETTELADRQIASLGDSLTDLRDRLGSKDTELEQARADVKAASERVTKLEMQLQERSSLVVGLEQEKIAGEQDVRALRSEHENLKAQLAKSKRHGAEHAEHIAQLDARLERQKELMAALEQELVQARQETSNEQKAQTRELAEKDRIIAGLRNDLAARSAPSESTSPAKPERPRNDPQQVAALRREVQKLERMLRDRTEEMTTLQWQHNVPGSTARTGADEAGPDGKMLVVLNRQLGEAREENERLSEKLRALEAELAARGMALALEGGVVAGEDRDDLTAIKGIGPKVAGQLQDLGIHSFLQLAQLKSVDLDDVAHPLNAFKGRIVRDAWIEQARQRAKIAPS